MRFLLGLSLAILLGLLCGTPAQGQTQAKSSPAAVEQYRVAAQYQKLEQYDLAADEWEKLVADFPEDPLAAAGRHYAGICQFQLKDYAQAAASFEAFLAKHPQHELLESTLTNLGLARYNQAQAAHGKEANKLYKQAIAAFRQQHLKFPDGKLAAQSEFYRGEALYALGKTAEAEQVYRDWLESYEGGPLDPNVRLALGATQTELGQAQTAIATLTELLSREPPAEMAPSAALRLGEALVTDGQFARAAEQFATAARATDFASADYALQQQAMALFQDKQFAEAAQVYESLPERFPKSPLVGESLASAGKSYYQAQQYDKAAELLSKARQVAQGDMELAHWWIRSLIDGGDAPNAVAAANEILAKKENARLLLGRILLDRADALYAQPERRGESVAAYIAAADAAEGDAAGGDLAAEARHLAGATALEVGEFTTAIAQAEKLVADAPDSSFALDARQTLAEAKLLSGDADEAASIYQELLNDAEGRQLSEWSLRLAWAQSAAGDEAAVMETLRPLVEQFAGGEKQQAQYLIGRALLRTEQATEAIAELTPVLESTPASDWSAESAILLARAQEAAGDRTAAIGALDKLIAGSPIERIATQATYLRGEIHQRAGDGPAAQADYAQVASDWPESQLAPYANYRWATIAMNAGDYAAAAERFAALLEKHPEHPLAAEARLARATSLARGGDPQAALAELNAITGESSANPRFLLARGTSLAELKQTDEAIAALRAAAESDVEFADRDRAWYELAWAYRDADQTDAAGQAFAKLAADFPNSELAADANYRLGEAAYDQGDYAAALEPFRAAANHPSADATLQDKSKHLAAWSLYKLGDPASAAEAFKSQLEDFPQGELAPDAQWMIGESLHAAGMHAEALAAYRAAEGAKPTAENLAPLGMLHAGQSAASLEQWEASRDWLAAAAQQYPDYSGRPEIDFELGQAQFKLGKLDEALALFQQVAGAEQTPIGARARFMVGELQFANKQYEDAVRSFFKVAYGYGGKEAPAEFHPWQAESLFEAARCLEQIQRGGAARKLYAELVERFPKQEKAQLAAERLKSP